MSENKNFEDEYTLSEIKKIQGQIRNYKSKIEERTKIKILYVDDEEKALVGFRASFRRLYDIYTANNAQEARSILKENEVEIIITDQKMPEETGVEFLSSIIEEHPLPIRILLTGYSDIDAVIEAINKGKIYSYISKPYHTDEMKQVIENAAEVYHLRKAKEALTEVALRANQQLEFMLRQKLID